MTVVQRVYSIILTVFLFCIFIFWSDIFSFSGNLYRQLPLCHVLKEETQSLEAMADAETLLMITEKNTDYVRQNLEIERNSKEEEQAEELLRKEEKKQAEEIKQTEERKKEEEQTIERTKEEGQEQVEAAESEEESQEVFRYLQRQAQPQLELSLKNLSDNQYMLNQFYIVDENTSADAVQLNASEFLRKDFSIEKNSSCPQILIYHTHSQEAFRDSREGVWEDTILGVGEYLTEILETRYGYQVLHVKETFDMMSGQLDRSKAYDYARKYIGEVLENNPSIEVVIDLHRDGVPDDRHLVTVIDEKPVAKLLFYNGLSYTNLQGEISYLPNPYIEDNLAFSFQLEYESALYFPELYRGIYLAGYRYNLHFMPRTLLLEAGAQNNSVQEVKNSMEYFSYLLNQVLTGNVVCPE